MNISEVEPALAQKLGNSLRDILQELSYTLPEHFQPHVSLVDANGRKKKSNAAASNWSPELGGRIEIWFEPVARVNKPATANALKHEGGTQTSVQVEGPAEAGTYIHPAEAELLRALNRAEGRPGWNFVPLKKFRDEILPLEHCPSMRTDVEQQSVLRSAIDKKLVLVGKVPNPRSPQFPVTTIRVNKLMPEVKAALGEPGPADSDFRPVEIRGEPLSSTILRERR